jgi:hypothetical protein
MNVILSLKKKVISRRLCKEFVFYNSEINPFADLSLRVIGRNVKYKYI